jgi:hypothetical protein
MVVRGQQRPQIQHFGNGRRWGSRVEHADGADRDSGADGGDDRRVRDLRADEHAPRTGSLHAGSHVSRVERAVGTGADRDLVLAVAVDDDQRHAGRNVVERHDPVQVDAGLEQVGKPDLGESVPPDRADQLDPRARPGGGERGVRALPAAVARRSVTDDGLAGARERAGGDDQVGVDRADDGDDRRRPAQALSP